MLQQPSQAVVQLQPRAPPGALPVAAASVEVAHAEPAVLQDRRHLMQSGPNPAGAGMYGLSLAAPDGT